MGMSILSLEVTNNQSIADAKTAVEILTGGTLDMLVNNAYFFHKTFLHLLFRAGNANIRQLQWYQLHRTRGKPDFRGQILPV